MEPLNLEGKDLESEVDSLALTQHLRKEVIKKLTSSGIPENDNEKMTLLLKAADGMDRVSLTRMRISVDSEASKTNSEVASAIADLLMKASSSGNKPFQSTAPIERDTPTLSNSIPRPDIVPGELDIGVSSETIDTFTARMKQNA